MTGDCSLYLLPHPLLTALALIFVPPCALSVRSLQATAAGAKEQDATNSLEKKFKAPPEHPLNADETVRLAITTMQGVLSSDFKATEIEISLVSWALISSWKSRWGAEARPVLSEPINPLPAVRRLPQADCQGGARQSLDGDGD